MLRMSDEAAMGPTVAMVAVMGCIIQQEATGTGPVANLKAHLADPAHNTIFNNFNPIVF